MEEYDSLRNTRSEERTGETQQGLLGSFSVFLCLRRQDVPLGMGGHHSREGFMGCFRGEGSGELSE